MATPVRRSLQCLFLFLAVASTAWAQGNGSAPGLLAREAGPSSPVHPGRGVVRSERVAPDRGVLQQLRTHLQSRPGEARPVVLRFFEDATFVVQIERVESVGLGAVSYHGRVAGRNDGHAVIVELNGNININVHAGGRTYEVRWFGNEGSFAREVDRSRLKEHPPTGAPHANIVPLPAPKATAGIRPQTAALMLDDGSQLDVMVLYTQAASVAHGGNGPMNLDAATAIAQVNQIYANSSVVQRLRLVYAGPVTHTETNLDDDLNALTDKTDGVLDDVHILRDAYGADFVSLWGVYPGDFCGLGWVMLTESSGFEATAFNVVADDCASSGVSLAHELGHNMGLRHDTYQLSQEGDSAVTQVTPAEGGGLTTITYPFGYVDTTNRFYTVMSYSTQCDHASIFCNSIPYFSNPAVSINAPYNGAFVPTGNATNAHEQRALNDTRETTANFRQSVVHGGPGTVAFMPKTYSAPESSGGVTLNVARLVGSSGAISVSYGTAGGTATAGSDYLSTSGTLSWPDGDTSTRTIVVPVLSDALTEGPETFTVVLSNATGGALVGSNGGAATVTIVDDEPDGFPASCATLPTGFTSFAPAWTTATDFFFGNPCSLRSAEVFGDLNSYATSDLQFSGNFAAGTVSFNYRVSALPTYGYFEFLVDGNPVHSETGETGWLSYSTPIGQGFHTLTWRFKNRLNVSCHFFAGATENCSDRTWIDNLIIPVSGPVTLASVVSRKSHPASGTWDVPIDASPPVTGSVSTEPRPASGGNHTIVFFFTSSIYTPGTVACTDETNAPIGNCSVVASGASAVVTVGSVPDMKRVKVALTNVNNGGTNVSASIGFFVGDVTGDRIVTASDILAAKGRTDLAIDTSTARYDDDLSGSLTTADVDAVKAKAGLSL